MGFRFRKSFKIAPGVKLNFNKKSAGLTFGGKGFHYTVNSKGKRTKSVGVPGTGLYYSTSSGGSSKKKTTKNQGSANSMNTTATKEKWYKNPVIIALLIFLFFPVGLFLMWKYTNWHKYVKIGLTAFFALFFIFALIGSGASDDTPASATGISSFSFTDSDAVELDVGDKEHSYFKVNGTDNFALENIKLISSNNSVVTFTYDKTISDNIYYDIEAIGEGTATIYVQTADGIVKSEEIQVTVIGDEETTKADETTTEKETTTQAPETTTEEKTTEAETTTKKQPVTEKQTTTERETTTEKPAGRTVYVTPNGKRYHFDPDCGGKNSRATSIDDVGGKTPCQKCAQ